jgi:predicted DNA-binding protein with PD1-like motif
VSSATESTRLGPGEDLRAGIEALVRKRHLHAAAIVTCVGSLAHARLRFADAAAASELPGPFEIVSLVGTIGVDGAHLHAALADAQGRVVGGHVAMGCVVFTTAEVVVLALENTAFRRRLDAATGYRELTIHHRRSTP